MHVVRRTILPPPTRRRRQDRRPLPQVRDHEGRTHDVDLCERVVEFGEYLSVGPELPQRLHLRGLISAPGGRDSYPARPSREEPPSTLLARSDPPTWMFVLPTMLKVAPPPHTARETRAPQDHPRAFVGQPSRLPKIRNPKSEIRNHPPSPIYTPSRHSYIR